MKKLGLLAVAVCVVVGVYSLPAMGAPGTISDDNDLNLPVKELFGDAERIDATLAGMEHVEFVKSEEQPIEGIPYQPMQMASPLAMELSNTELASTESIQTAIHVLDEALGKAGVKAIVYSSDEKQLALSIIMLAKVIDDVVAEKDSENVVHDLITSLAKEFERSKGDFSSNISGGSVATDIFNWAMDRATFSLDRRVKGIKLDPEIGDLLKKYPYNSENTK